VKGNAVNPKSLLLIGACAFLVAAAVAGCASSERRHEPMRLHLTGTEATPDAAGHRGIPAPDGGPRIDGRVDTNPFDGIPFDPSGGIPDCAPRIPDCPPGVPGSASASPSDRNLSASIPQ
jgi:hypothetical protein